MIAFQLTLNLNDLNQILSLQAVKNKALRRGWDESLNVEIFFTRVMRDRSSSAGARTTTSTVRTRRWMIVDQWSSLPSGGFGRRPCFVCLELVPAHEKSNLLLESITWVTVTAIMPVKRGPN